MPTEYSPSGGSSKSTLARRRGVRHLGQDVGAVPGVGPAGGAAMVQAVRGQPGRDDRARPASAGVGHEGDTAGVPIVAGPGRGGRSGR